MNKFEIWEESDGEFETTWIARDQDGNEGKGTTPEGSLVHLLNENAIRHNLATGRTCSRCSCGHDTGGGEIRCDLWDEGVEEWETPPDGWEEYNEPGDTCRDFHGG